MGGIRISRGIEGGEGESLSSPLSLLRESIQPGKDWKSVLCRLWDQPMALDQVLSDRDSEDEVDDDIADFEDRRLLDDFVDVTKDEKQIMHLWNSFVRKQRVLADGHIPWACEAFSKLHGRDLVRAPALIWCWRLFMIKLWNHSLLDARTMNSCNIILENYRNEIAWTLSRADAFVLLF